MAATDFGALSEARKRVWSAKTWQEGRDKSFWMSNGFVGDGEGSSGNMNKPIQRITELTKTSRGIECVMQLVQDLQEDGIAGDNELDGNEEALVNDAQVIRIDQLRHGVKSKGEMAEQATVIRFRAEARGKLAFWLSDKVDEMMFLVGAGRAFSVNTNGSARGTSQLPQLSFAADVVAPSSNRIIYGGTATSEGTLTTAMTMTWDLIVKARTYAERQKVKPIRDRGKDYYALVMSPEQRRDLVLSDDYKTIVSQGRERGSQNPLFNNAMAVIDGVILYSHNKVYNTQGLTSGVDQWGSGFNVNGAQAMLLGASAMGFATIENSFMRESDKTDYGNRPGIAFGRKLGMLKPQYITSNTSGAREDFGIVTIKTAAAA